MQIKAFAGFYYAVHHLSGRGQVEGSAVGQQIVLI